MNEEKQLPIPAPSVALTIPASSSLLDRGLAGLRRNAEDDEAEKLYQRAMALCAGIPKNAGERLAEDLFRQAAKLGHREAKFCLGEAYSSRDRMKALYWYHHAADQGHPGAAYICAKDYPKLTSEQVIELLEVAASGKHLQAILELGRVLVRRAQNNEGGEKESLLIRAVFWLRQGAELGDGDCAILLVDLLCDSEGDQFDYAEAAKWYELAANKSHKQATLKLANLYEKGLGVQADKDCAIELYLQAGNLSAKENNPQEAIYCFKQAFVLGDAKSAFLIGNIYMNEDWEVEDEDIQELVLNALSWWEKSAEQNYMPAAIALADFHEEMGNSPELSIRWRRVSAELGDIESQFSLGKHYSTAPNIDYREAVHWFRKAAEQEHAEAAYHLGLMLLFGDDDGENFDEKESAKWMIFAAEHNHEDAFFDAGWMLHEGFGIERDDVKAVDYYRKAAKKNNPEAINGLGCMYANGFGVKKDEVFAFRYFKLGAKLGWAPTKTNLAICYKKGIGTEADLDEALYWMREAAEEDEEATAQFNLGLWYLNGELFEQGDEMAIYWIEKAANQGHKYAKNHAGWMHQIGKGCEIDLAKAREYYLYAAYLDLAAAQFNLAIMYERGCGVDVDVDEAIRWYRLAARQMDQDAIDALTRLGVDIHGPVTRPVTPKISIEVEDRVRKALENVLSKDSAKLTQNK